jgi:hypothetical protein
MFSPFYDVLVLKFFNMSHCPLRLHPDTALVSGGTKGANPRHVVRNSFLLKLVTLKSLTPDFETDLDSYYKSKSNIN